MFLSAACNNAKLVLFRALQNLPSIIICPSLWTRKRRRCLGGPFFCSPTSITVIRWELLLRLSLFNDFFFLAKHMERRCDANYPDLPRNGHLAGHWPTTSRFFERELDVNEFRRTTPQYSAHFGVKIWDFK